MSAEFYITYLNNDFRVRVDHDGTMVIVAPPMDLEYDIAFVAMGGKKSAALRLLDHWNHDPILVVTTPYMATFTDGSEEFEKTLHRLALDWAEHTLHIYWSTFSKKQAYLRSAIKEARVSLRTDAVISLATRRSLSAYASLVSDEAIDPAITPTSSQESLTKSWGRWYSIDALILALSRNVKECSDRAATAFANSFVLPERSKEWNEAYCKERSWQIRRLVDVVEALQSNKPWPQMRVTK